MSTRDLNALELRYVDRETLAQRVALLQQERSQLVDDLAAAQQATHRRARNEARLVAALERLRAAITEYADAQDAPWIGEDLRRILAEQPEVAARG